VQTQDNSKEKLHFVHFTKLGASNVAPLADKRGTLLAFRRFFIFSYSHAQTPICSLLHLRSSKPLKD